MGAITLANVWPPPPRDSIAMELLDAAIDAIGSRDADQRPKSPGPELPPEIDKYLGSYFAEPYVHADLTRSENALRLEPGSPDTMLLHTPCDLAIGSAGDCLEIRVLNGRGAGEKLDFQFGPGDSVTGFLLGGFLYEKTG